jgi:COP9 signalosome complex subunit 2
VLADPFIAENIDEVSRNMRTKAILKLIAPYTRFSLQFISKHIKISVHEVLEILSFLILDHQLNAKIDQENGTVVVESASDVERLRALEEWSSSLKGLWQTALNGEGFRPDELGRGQGGPVFTPGYGNESPSALSSMNARRRELRARQLAGKVAGAV